MRVELKEVYNWYEKNGGKIFIERYTNQADFIKKNYKTNGTKEVSGVYLIKFNDIPIAVGESKQLGVRFLEHMERLVLNGEWYWGLNPSEVENNNVKLTIDILENGLLNGTYRENREVKMIDKIQPIFQIKYDKYYPYDKSEKKNGKWVDRGEIRSDQYIRRKLRKERVNDVLNFRSKQ